MLKWTNLNKQFYDKTGQVYPSEPTVLPVKRRAELMAYITSEVMEFGNTADLPKQVDAMGDALYFILDAFLEMGVDPLPVIDIIHLANMEKTWPDGETRWDNTVLPPKLIKPPGWVDPIVHIEEYIEWLKGEYVS